MMALLAPYFTQAHAGVGAQRLRAGRGVKERDVSMQWLVRCALLLVSMVACTAGMAQVTRALPVCDDGAGWPPYTFADPVDPQRIRGASADLITQVLQRAGYTPRITLLPWKRCLAEVEAGRMAMLINASFSAERAQKYLMSRPYYSIHSALFYLRTRFLTPPVLTTPADLNRYRYCGLFGYNYSMYAIAPDQINTGARDEATRFEMLRLGRCDFVLGDLEVLQSFAAMGQVNLSAIAHMAIPDAKPKEFHALVSRAWPDAGQLLQLLNDGIAAAKADKSYDRIFRSYGL